MTRTSSSSRMPDTTPPSGVPPQRPAGSSAGPNALGRCPTQGRPTPPAAHPGPSTAARRRVRLRTSRHLGHPGHETATDTRLYGTATARSWNRLHPRLTHRSSWASADGTLPIVEGTVIRLDIDHLPSGATPKPVWLWWSGTDASATDIDRLWQAYLRRFDIEHTFPLFKQTLGWTTPKIRTPEAADRWTWLILAAYTQPRLARPLAADLRHPWERPSPSHRLTPARIRRDFRHIRPKTACPAQTPKPSRPGPGRPPGRTNTHPTQRHDVHTPSRTQPAKRQTAKSATPKPRRTG